MTRHPDRPVRAERSAASTGEGAGVRLRVWPEEEFLARGDDYRELLRRSDADRLFMSWEWLVEWWRLHKDPFGLRLIVFSVEAEDGRLLGVAPMTVRSFRHRGGIVGTRLEPLGNLVREKGAALTEYVTFPVDRRDGLGITRLLVRFLFDGAEWDDFFPSFMPLESHTWRTLLEHQSVGTYVRTPDFLVARKLDLRDGFSAFLDGLGPKTRLRVYHGRKRLAQVGPVEFVVANAENLEDCLRVLDRLHTERWGVPALSGPRGDLYRGFAERGLADGSLSLCHLAVGGQPLAAALNLRRNDCEYGIQMAASRNAPNNVSPGYLHLGFMIERCCQDGIRYFDFLAGEGGEGDYRRHFGADTSGMGSVQIIRSKKIAAAYRIADLSRGFRDRLTGRPKPDARPGSGV
jgi:CelD/BcsL family acetyltransferase involved in cellulose biosynthesis